MALYIREEEIEALVTIDDVIAAVRAITRAQAEGKAWLVPRERLRMPKGMLHTMSAAWPGRGYFAHKAYASVAGEIRFRVHLYDAATGAIVCTMQGNRLGQMRTGAATAVAAEHLLPTTPDPSWAIFGTGLQAYGQIEALLKIATPQILHVFSRSQQNRDAFCRKLVRDFDLNVSSSPTPDECVDDADVVITATTAKDPVFSGKSLKKGAFVAAVGANLLVRRELDGAALRTIDRVIVDDLETAQKESGMLQTPMQAGFMQWNQIRNLPDLVAGYVPGRQNNQETLCFHSLGSATWDLAVGILAYERARENKAGTEIPLD